MPAAVLLVFVSLAAAGCGFFDKQARFETGSCVLVDLQLIDYDMEEADCSDDPPMLEGEVYKVGLVIDGAHETCVAVPGTRATFSDEPDDLTYCLLDADADPPADDSSTDPVAPPGEVDDGFTGDGAPPECVNAQLEGTPIPAMCEEYGYDPG